VSLLACPIDLLPLTFSGATYRCAHNHAYDQSRDGYVNLLPPGKPSRLNSGDDLDSIHARRRFLDAGHYAPLAQQVAEAVAAAKPDASVADIGCGEGYYTAQLTGREVVGLDLSRAGIRLAARRHKQATFAIGNAMALPIVPSSVEVAVSVFAPVVPDEFARVVAPGGHAVIAVPGADELFELIRTERVRSNITLAAADALSDLLTMTPYRFAVPPEAIERALAAPTPLLTSIDFVVAVLRRR